MLPKPSRAVALKPEFQPVLDLLDSVMVKPKELAKHHRQTTSHLCNLRGAGKGIPFVKTGSGAILYRLSEIVADELNNTHGPITLERLSLALYTMPGLSLADRLKIEDHLKRVFAHSP